MLTLINKTDMTSYIPYDSINIEQTAGDPTGKATFQLIDPGSTISLTSLQEVIFYDETATLGGVTLIPTHNYLNNNNFNYGNAGWGTGGALTSDIIFPSSGTFGSGAKCTMTINNVASGVFGEAAQNVGGSYVVVGQSYCFSASMNITTPFAGGDAFIHLWFFDASGGVTNNIKQTFTAATGGYSIVSVTGVAAANTVTIQVDIGIETSSSTNSGSVAWTALQLEPVWFPSLYSYPTPIADFLQANCVTIGSDGTISRYSRVFTGFISHLTASYEGTTRIWDVEVTSLDGMLENATLVNATFSGVTDQIIITNVINGFSFTLLAANTPSVATGTPQALAYRNIPVCYAGVSVSDLEFADATPREVLNALADITGFLFGVDPYYNVFYYPPMYVAAPYAFAGNGTQPDGINTFAYYDYSIEYDASQIQSAINVSGTTYQLTITEAWHKGDGSHVEVTVGSVFGAVLFHQPITVPSSVVVGGVTQTCAQDTGNGFGSSQSLCNLGTQEIELSPVPSNGTSISITYTYIALVYVQVRSPDSIGKYGRPLYSKINDTNLVTNAQATTEGEAQLTAYAEPRTTLKFKTTKFLSPGMTIELTSTLDGITKGHYSVQKVTATNLSNGLNQYEIEAGFYVDSFVDFFRNSQKAINRADHDPAEPIKQTNNLLLESASLTDSLSIHP